MTTTGRTTLQRRLNRSLFRRGLLDLLDTTEYEQPGVPKEAYPRALQKMSLAEEHGFDVLLSTDEVASLVGCSQTTVNRWKKRGLITAHKHHVKIGLRGGGGENWYSYREVMEVVFNWTAK